MKVLGRTLIILVMALLVAGLTIAISRTSLAAQLAPNSPKSGFEHQGGLQRGVEGMEGDTSQGDFQGGVGRGRRIEEGFDWATWLKNLSIIGTIILVVVLLDRVRFYIRNRANKTA
jgi:hypothetical protein